MDWTEEDIATLKAAIASGVQTVSYSGPPARTITYQSLAEMRKLLAAMVVSTGGGSPGYKLISTSKGF
jgi:predicted glycosyltransferase